MSLAHHQTTGDSKTLLSHIDPSVNLSTQGDLPKLKERHIVHACEIVCEQLQKSMNDIGVLGSVMSLYRAADAIKSALHDLVHYYEIISPEIHKERHHHKKHKQMEKEHHELDAHLKSKKDADRPREPVQVFQQIMSALKKFEFAFKDFHDYVDVEGERVLHSLVAQTTVVHVALTELASASEAKNVQQFTIDIGKELTPLLMELPAILQRFTSEGIPCIKVSQKRSATLRTNTATVATFFAGVAASALQFSVGAADNALQVAANTLWFSSLVLSIGSATCALLAMTWQQAVFSSPARDLPWFVTFWTRQGFLVLLIASVVSFVAGLLAFIFNTQNVVAFWVTLGCVAFCSIGLFIVVVWVVYEREEFDRLRRIMRSEHPFAAGSFLLSRVGDTVRSTLDFIMRRKRVSDKVRQEKLAKKAALNNTLVPLNKAPSANEDRLKQIFFVQKVMKPEIPAITSTAVSHMSSSPQGKWVVVCYENSEQCCLFRLPSISDTQLTDFFELEHGGASVAQVVWSPYHNDQLFATRSDNGVRVWNIEDWGDKVSCQTYLSIHDEVVYESLSVLWIQWIRSEAILVLVTDGSSTSVREFDVYNEEERHSFDLPTIKDLHFSELQCDNKDDLLFFIASRRIQDQRIDSLFVRHLRPQPSVSSSQTVKAVQHHTPHIPGLHLRHHHKVDMDQSTYGILTRIPLAHHVQSLELYRIDPDKKLIVLGYEHNPPEIWSYSFDPSNNSVTISRIQEFSDPSDLPSHLTYWDDAFLAGPRREELVCSANDKIYFWDRSNGILLREVKFDGCPSDEDPELAWTSAADVSVSILGAWGDGEMCLCSNRWGESGSGTRYSPKQEGLLLDPGLSVANA